MINSKFKSISHISDKLEVPDYQIYHSLSHDTVCKFITYNYSLHFIFDNYITSILKENIIKRPVVVH